MPGVGGEAPARGDLDHRKPYGDEELRLVALAQLLIDVFQYLRGALAELGAVFDQGLRDHHEQRRGHALAGNVRHHKAQVIVVHQEKVVKIAADLLGRGHGGVEVKLRPLREGREDPRQHIRLDLGGDVQLRADALLFGGNGGQVRDVAVDIPLHLLHGVAECFHFIAGPDVQLGDGGIPRLLAAVVLHEGARRVRQLVDGFDQDLGNAEKDDCDQYDNGDPHEKHDAVQIIRAILHDVVHGNVHTDPRDRISVSVPHRLRGRNEPAVGIVRDEGRNALLRILCFQSGSRNLVGGSELALVLRTVGVHDVSALVAHHLLHV